MSWLELVGMLGSSSGTITTSIQQTLLLQKTHMLDKNTAGQYWPVMAISTSTGLPVSGDAANITADISIDAAALAATNDVNPTELGSSGIYLFTLTQAETNGDLLVLSPATITAGTIIISLYGAVNTRNTVNSEVTAALTAQGYTTARATKIDQLDEGIVDAITQIVNAMTQPSTLP